MTQPDFVESINKICTKDKRYDIDAYFFVRNALDYTSKIYNKPQDGKERHVSGQELLEGIRQAALNEFGPMALSVLRNWRITKTEDFGEIVFNMVESGCLGCTEEDKKEDFKNGYDFEEAFTKPYLPKTAMKSTAKPKTKSTSRKTGKTK